MTDFDYDYGRDRLASGNDDWKQDRESTPAEAERDRRLAELGIDYEGPPADLRERIIRAIRENPSYSLDTDIDDAVGDIAEAVLAVVARYQQEHDAAIRQRIEALQPEDLARLFHEKYERLAPDFGYKTRDESAVPWLDVPERNRRLMVAVAREVKGWLLEALAPPAPSPLLQGIHPPGYVLPPGTHALDDDAPAPGREEQCSSCKRRPATTTGTRGNPLCRECDDLLDVI